MNVPNNTSVIHDVVNDFKCRLYEYKCPDFYLLLSIDSHLNVRCLVLELCQLDIGQRQISAKTGLHRLNKSSICNAIPASREPLLIVTSLCCISRWSKMMGILVGNNKGVTVPTWYPVSFSMSDLSTHVMRRQPNRLRTLLGSAKRSPGIQASAYKFPISRRTIHLTICSGKIPLCFAASSIVVAGD